MLATIQALDGELNDLYAEGMKIRDRELKTDIFNEVQDSKIMTAKLISILRSS